MWRAIMIIHLSILGQVWDGTAQGLEEIYPGGVETDPAVLRARESKPVNPELLPPSVRSVVSARQAYDTAEIHWTITHLKGRDSGLTERVTTREEGETIWEVNEGDENGYHTKAENMDGSPIPNEELAGDKHNLLYSGQVWSYNYFERKPSSNGFVTPIQNLYFFSPFDFDYAGLAPTWDVGRCSNTLCLPPDFVAGLKDMRFQDNRNGFTEVVVGSSDKYQIEWHLDHQQGGEPVFAAFYVNDTLTLSSVTEYQELGGRRVPLSITFFRGNNPKPIRRIDVQTASFDQPEHVKDISPADMGILVGAQMSIGRAPWALDWDGNELVTLEEFNELYFVFGLELGPKMQKMWVEGWANNRKRPVEEYDRYLERARVRWRKRYFKRHGEKPWLRKKDKEKDEWDVYVEKFVKEHKFDKEHQETAKHVLESAKKIRDRNGRATKREMAQARKEGEYRRADALGEKIDKVKDRIFKRMLVRGLTRLAKKAKSKNG